ncbi:MAG: RsmB/NOP family class I SAM-dependent RNA methyltransferase [Bdellovibrionota bacterium]
MKVSNNFSKLRDKLFPSESERQLFEQALDAARAQSPALIWVKDRPQESSFAMLERAAFQPSFVDRVAPDTRAGAHAFHEQGFYYCLDCSSVFEASVTSVISPKPRLVLDMCAAPGGKTVFLSRAFEPELLVANEAIRKRTAQLISNIRRCGIAARVCSRDPSFFAEQLPAAFDLVLVDAPCSGQSLLARGQKAPGCFHPSTINLCSNRQKRIVANAAASVAAGGYLAYMTCTYSPEENERVVEWLLKKFPQFHPCAVPTLAEFQSQLTEIPCYRLFPQQGLGAGGFTALLKNSEPPSEDRPSTEELLDRIG